MLFRYPESAVVVPRDLEPNNPNAPRGWGSFNAEGEEVVDLEQLDTLGGIGSINELAAWRQGAPLDVSLRP